MTDIQRDAVKAIKKRADAVSARLRQSHRYGATSLEKLEAWVKERYGQLNPPIDQPLPPGRNFLGVPIIHNDTGEGVVMYDKNRLDNPFKERVVAMRCHACNAEIRAAVVWPAPDGHEYRHHCGGLVTVELEADEPLTVEAKDDS